MIPVLVLAAGASSRMGRCKLTLPFSGALLVTPVLRLAREFAGGKTLVVVAPQAENALLDEIARHNLDTVVAEQARLGQAVSLKAGVCAVARRWPDAPGVLVLLGDLPLLDPQTVRAVLDVFAEHPTCAVAAEHRDSGQRGHPVILPRDAFPMVEALTGDAGARHILQRFHLQRVPVSDPGILCDVDTPEAYAALSAKRSERCSEPVSESPETA